MTLSGRDIVCVGFADWQTEVWTNQHHLMVRLGRENRVLFIESLGLRRPQLAARDLKRMGRRLMRGLRGTREIDGLHVLSPLVVPWHHRAWVRKLNTFLLRRVVRRATARLGFSRPILWAYVPQARVLIDVLDPSVVVYHCVDDLAATKGIDASVRVAEAQFAHEADLILASSPPLTRRMGALSHNVIEMRNVADTRLFSQALKPGPIDTAMSALPTPRILFAGAVVATKLDVPLLTALADRCPSWSFVFVGPIGAGDPRTDIRPLQRRANAHLLGLRAHEQLPDVMRGADAAIIPYALNELTASIFPMKVYEYLAAGLPVVATPLPALAATEGILFAQDAEEMARGLARLMQDDGPSRRLERSDLAASHSWEGRLAEIAAALERAESARVRTPASVRG